MWDFGSGEKEVGMILITQTHKRVAGTTLLGVIVALASFSIISLVFFKWQTLQSQQAKSLYEQIQIQRIIENQRQQQWLHLACDQEIYQNQRRFFIQCHNGKVIVRAKMG